MPASDAARSAAAALTPSSGSWMKGRPAAPFMRTQACTDTTVRKSHSDSSDPGSRKSSIKPRLDPTAPGIEKRAVAPKRAQARASASFDGFRPRLVGCEPGATKKDQEDHVKRDRSEVDSRTAMRRLESFQVRRNLFGCEATSF